MPEVLSALIIGCGDIAGGYDEAGDERAVRTHAGAYRAHPNFCVTACIDPDDQRRQQTRRGVPGMRRHSMGVQPSNQKLLTDLTKLSA